MNKEAFTTPALEALLHAPSLAILAVDKQGCVILWSPSASRMFGWTESEVLGRFLPIVPEEHRQGVYHRIQSELNGEITSALDVRRLRKDGSLIDISLWSAPLRDSNGEIIGILGLYADITARKQAEEALRDSEARFRGIFTAAASGIVLVSPEGRFLHANPAFCEFLGYSEQELLSKRVQDVTHPDDRERTAEIRRGIWEGKKSLIQRYEKRYLRKDGQTVWGEVSISLIRDAMGNANYSVTEVLDITERKKAEAALKESEERFRQVAASAGEFIWEVDAKGLYTYASPSVEKLLGYTPEELVGKKHFYDLFIPSVRDELKAAAFQAFADRQTFRNFPNANVSKSGEIVYLETSGAPVLDSAGNLVGYRGADTDVTARKQSEEALRESEERYRTLAESAADAIFIIDRDDRVQYLNTYAASMMGSTPKELTGKQRAELFPPDTSGHQRLEIEAVFESGRPRRIQNRTPFTGGELWLDTQLVPLRSAGGEVSAVMGISRDVTAQKRAEDRLEERVRERTAELAQSNVALRNSEAKYRTLVEQIPAITYIAALDEASTTLYVSPQIESLLGLTPADYKANLHGVWLQHLHPDDRERVVAELRHTHTSLKPFDCEYRMLNRGGEIVWFRDKAAVVCDEAGRPLFLQGVMLDVTERRQAEETMQLQSTALQAAANSIVITDREGDIVWANPAFTKLTGYELTEVIGKNPRVLKSGQHDKAFYQNLWHTVLSGQVWHGEIVNKRKNGRLYTEEMTITPVRNAAGEIAHFIGIKQDITEWKLAEEARARLAAIVEFSDDAIVSAELDGTITSWNAGAQRLYSYAPEEVLGRPVSVVVPRNRRGEMREIRKKLRCGEHIQHYETVRLKKGGIPVDVSITISPIKNDAGQVIGISAITRDITERKELERAIVEASSREQRRIGQDLHDGLCQQLTGISFLWKAIAQRKAVRALPKAAEVAEISQLITKTIGEARDLARVLCPVELEDNDLGMALKNLGLSMERLFAISCVVRCQQPEPLADKTVVTHLYRIAQEAISNAIHHGKAARVWIHLISKKNRLTLRIRDNGSGFSKRRGFKEGIGMRSMRYRAQVIGGSLTTESKRGAGTTVACVCTQPRSRFAGEARRRTPG